MKMTGAATRHIPAYLKILQEHGSNSEEARDFRTSVIVDDPDEDGLLRTMDAFYALDQSDTTALIANYTDVSNQHGPGSAEAQALRHISAGNAALIKLMDTVDGTRAWLNQPPVTIIGVFHVDGKALPFVASLRHKGVDANGRVWEGAVDQWPIDDGRARPLRLMHVAYDPDSRADLVFRVPGSQGQPDHLFKLTHAGATDYLGWCTIGNNAPALAACGTFQLLPQWLDTATLETLVRTYGRR